MSSDFTNNAARPAIKVISSYKSTNDKEDFIEIQLKRYIIALQILESHNLIEEFRRAVKGGANLPTEAIFGEEVVIETR